MPAPNRKPKAEATDPDGIFESDVAVVDLAPQQQFQHRMLKPAMGIATDLDLRGTGLTLRDITNRRYVPPRYKLQVDDVVLVKEQDDFKWARVWKLDHEGFPFLVPMNL